MRDADRFGFADRAVAGIDRRQFGGRLAVHQRHDVDRADLGLRVGRIAGLRHRPAVGRQQCRIAEDVDVLVDGRLEGDRIDRAPALLVVREPCGDGNVAGALGRNHVGYRDLVVVEVVGDDYFGLGVDLGDLAADVREDVLVVVVPGLGEQAFLRDYVGVGVEHDQLGLRLVLLEIARNQAGALVWAGRAAEGHQRHADHHRAAILHRLQLLAQQGRLRAGLPGVRENLRCPGVITFDFIGHEVDAGRDDQAVIGEPSLAGHHHLCGGVDGRGIGMQHLDAVIGHQLVVLDGQRLHVRHQAGDVEVAERAGNEFLVALDQNHLDGFVEHAQIFCGNRAAIAAADDDDAPRAALGHDLGGGTGGYRRSFALCGGMTGQGQPGGATQQLDEISTI